MNMIEKLEPILIFGAIILGLLFKDISLLNNIKPLTYNCFSSINVICTVLDIPSRILEVVFQIENSQ